MERHVTAARSVYVATRRAVAEAKNDGLTPEGLCQQFGVPYLPGGGWIFASAQVAGVIAADRAKVAE